MSSDIGDAEEESSGPWVESSLRKSKETSNLQGVYKELAEAAHGLETSPKRQSFGCPPGCGICCKGFDPDITRPELDHVAKWLADHPEMDHRVFAPRDSQETTCRFYREDSPFHCSIYPIRPLVCRTFAYTTTRDKQGEPVFTYCKHMPTTGPRVLRGKEIPLALGVMPPAAEDAGSQVMALGSDERVSLSDSIGQAVEYWRYRNHLELLEHQELSQQPVVPKSLDQSTHDQPTLVQPSLDHQNPKPDPEEPDPTNPAPPEFPPRVA